MDMYVWDMTGRSPYSHWSSTNPDVLKQGTYENNG